MEGSPQDPRNGKSDAIRLKKQISLFNCVSIIIGTMIGSGIFVSPVGILLNVKSVGLSLVLWIVCGLHSGLCALCYAELGAAMPESGGEYIYIMKAFGDLPAFLTLWTHLVLSYCIGYAALCLVFSTYILQPLFPDCTTPELPLRLICALIYTLITAMNCRNVKWATKTQTVTTFGALLALSIVIIIGIIRLTQGETIRFQNIFEGSDYNPGSMAIGFYSGSYAFLGWSNICLIAGEVVKPQRNIPLSIIISISVVTLAFVLANIGYFAVLSPNEMLKSPAVAVTFAERTMGPAAFVMPLLIAMAIIGTLNGSSLSFSRLLFIGSKMNHIPQFISMISVHNRTPSPSLIFISLIVLMLQNIDGIFVLIELSVFGCIAVITTTIAALLYLRFTQKNLVRPFKLNIIIPISMFIVSLLILVLTVYQKPRESGFAILTILLGIPVYILGPRWKQKPAVIQNKIDTVTKTLQKIFVVVKEE